MCLGCLFQDCFLIVSGSVLGLILEPFGRPNGIYVEGFGGVHFQMDFGCGLGAHRIPGARPGEGKWMVPGPYTNKQTVGYRIQATGHKQQDTGYRIHRIQDAGYKIDRIQDAG